VKLRVALVDAKRCTPLSSAALDVWHCDAGGVYSGFTSSNPDGPGRGRGLGGRPGPGMPPPPDGAPFFGSDGPPPGLPGARRARKIDGTRFLRGVQITNEQATAEIATVFITGIRARSAEAKKSNPPLTKSAGELREGERLAADGNSGADFAFAVGHAILLRRAQKPKISAIIGDGLSTGSADGLEVGGIWLNSHLTHWDPLS
jgi:hypothetical protein